MMLTERRVRQIIREEMTHILREDAGLIAEIDMQQLQQAGQQGLQYAQNLGSTALAQGKQLAQNRAAAMQKNMQRAAVQTATGVGRGVVQAAIGPAAFANADLTNLKPYQQGSPADKIAKWLTTGQAPGEAVAAWNQLDPRIQTSLKSLGAAIKAAPAGMREMMMQSFISAIDQATGNIKAATTPAAPAAAAAPGAKPAAAAGAYQQQGL
jgi:hypothetical protein